MVTVQLFLAAAPDTRQPEKKLNCYFLHTLADAVLTAPFLPDNTGKGGF